MTTRSEAYAAFAYAYDQALGHRFFKAVRSLLDEHLAKYPTPDKTHLDIACGTGLALEYFAKRGWRSTGVDASMEMLNIARKRATRLVAGDFLALPLRGTFARITCLYDSLNHIRERDELVAAFRSMRRLMSHGSLLMFDINHPDIYPEIWGMAEPFVAEGKDYQLEIATTFRKREATGRARVTGWAKLPDGVKVAIDERHQQRAWREREIADALSEADLAPLDVIEFDPFGEADSIEAPTVKLFYVCRPSSSRA
ncbi:MAG TPA: class I SAM-dependent methyltransferase [Thermoanaerobaculia bacterium]|nr:class I SAM-dependent methyltransferase [Thermoanaerobaculia bacterium]